jgi:hypothetical protein
LEKIKWKEVLVLDAAAFTGKGDGWQYVGPAGPVAIVDGELTLDGLGDAWFQMRPTKPLGKIARIVVLGHVVDEGSKFDDTNMLDPGALKTKFRQGAEEAWSYGSYTRSKLSNEDGSLAWHQLASKLRKGKVHRLELIQAGPLIEASLDGQDRLRVVDPQALVRPEGLVAEFGLGLNVKRGIRIKEIRLFVAENEAEILDELTPRPLVLSGQR